MQDAIMNWSGGKDSALALTKAINSGKYRVQQLFTTMSEEYERITMHGVRKSLLMEQSRSIGKPLDLAYLSKNPTNAEYEKVIAQKIEKYKTAGISLSIFGDIYLEDLRKYREEQLRKAGFEAVFPLWGGNTKDLIHKFIDLGFKTVVTAVDNSKLDKSFAGRTIDKHFLKDLPEDVDPCGENGEFHTFVFDGPLFQYPVQFVPGELTFKEYPSSDKRDTQPAGFWFKDLLPA